MKNDYVIYDQNTAPEGSREYLGAVAEHYGFIPNALGAMAEAPKTLEAYISLDHLVRQTDFSDVERHVLLLTVSRELGCAYCVAAHTAFAQMDKVEADTIGQLRDGKPLSDKKLEGLHSFVAKLVHSGCNVSDQDVQTFLHHGYSRTNILEAILVIANKMIAVYANRIMGTDLDEALQPARWDKVA